MFFDEKTAGIEIIQNGVRLATGGAVRLSPTPEQWDQIPKVIDRKVDKATNTITCVLRYEAFDFDSRLVVTPEGTGFRVAVYVDKPVPEKLEGRAGLNLEFLPSQVLRAHVPRRRQARDLPALSHRADRDQTRRHEDPPVRGLLDVRRSGPERVRGGPARGRPDKTLVLAPEDPERRITHRGRVRRAPAARRAQPRPERLVHRPIAAADRRRRGRWRNGWSARTSSRTGRGRRSSASRRSGITRRRRRWRSSNSTRTTRPSRPRRSSR